MKILVTTKAELKNLLRLKNNLKDQALNDLLEGIGIYMVGSTRKNFEEGGRPFKWKELKKATLERKRGTKILVDSGGLAMGTASEVAARERAVYIGPTGPSKKYARRHNKGDEGGEPIPQRQFLLMQDEDAEYIDAFTRVSML